MTRARPALGEGLGEPVWEQRPGLATSTQRAGTAHARLLIFMRGVSYRGHAPFLQLMGRGSSGRNLEGAGGLSDALYRPDFAGPNADPLPSGALGRAGRGTGCGEELARARCSGPRRAL